MPNICEACPFAGCKSCPADSRHQLVTAADAGPRLVVAAPGPVGVDVEARTISGVVVPYGPAGFTSGGALRFKRGSLRISEPKRVKLLREHDQREPIGVGLSFEDTDAGLVGTFAIPEGPDGDRALAEAANGLRDAFSVGVQLDDKTLTNLRRAKQGTVTDASGDLREVSQVSVPAFDDARIAAAAGADLTVSAWSTTSTDHLTTSAAGAGNPDGGTMTEEQRRRLFALLAQASLSDDERTELDELQQLATAAGIVTTPAATGPNGQPAAAPAGTATAAAGPAVVPAVAGAAAHVTSEPSTYTFNGEGSSLVADLFAGAVRHDPEAQQRVDRFNAELRDENPASVVAFVTAAATRDDVDGAGTDLPPAWGGGTQYRPNLMRELVDVKRPIISRLTTVPIKNAQPFAIPTVGEFTGVGDHTEGQPHRPAGSFTIGAGDTIQPKATSGAWEVSRELLDAGNPVLDRVAVRAMMRDYRRQSEGKMVALLNAFAATDTGNVYGVDTPLALRGAMLDFVNDDDEPADLVGVSKGMLRILGMDTDTTERPQLPFIGPVNAQGTMRAGYTGIAIDGQEIFRAARLDAGVSGATVAGSVGFTARSEGLLWCESNVLQFRFDEVLGPGVIKFALWAYSGAAILDTDDVAILNTGADPTP